MLHKDIYHKDFYYKVKNKARDTFSKILKEFELTEIKICFSNVELFQNFQTFLNDFGLCLYSTSENIYQLIPPIRLDAKFTINIRHNEFGWDVGDYSNTNLDDFLNIVLSDSGFATNVDQEGFLWKPSAFTSDWYCYINNKWLIIDVEDHVQLTFID